MEDMREIRADMANHNRLPFASEICESYTNSSMLLLLSGADFFIYDLLIIYLMMDIYPYGRRTTAIAEASRPQSPPPVAPWPSGLFTNGGQHPITMAGTYGCSAPSCRPGTIRATNASIGTSLTTTE